MSGEQFVCQVCGSGGMERLLDLGNQPLCNDFLPVGDAPGPQTYYPLCVCFCHHCSLAQLDYVIPTDFSFGDQYTYLTGSSESLIKYYSELANKLIVKFGLEPGDTVIDIGSNDGTFLKAFQSFGMDVLGIEGASQAYEIAADNGIPVIQQFFGEGLAGIIEKRIKTGSKIRLVLAMNVLAHTDNINEFLTEVGKLTGPETVFVSQSHWLVELVRKFEFDTIYHEHLRYYTLTSLIHLFKRHDLYVEDAELVDFYGGSVLVYAKNSVGDQSENVKSILAEEAEIDILGSLRNMKREMLNNKARLLNLLVEIRNKGKQVVGIGAPMKASTLLNFYGITPDLLGYIAEVNQLKVGTVVPGVRIPVVHEDVVFEEQPDYALLLSWNMADFLIPKLRSRGFQGKFILPVPQVEVID